jgi:hypothetical protein
MKPADRHHEPSADHTETAIPRIVAIHGYLWIGGLCALAVILCLLWLFVPPADSDARIVIPIGLLVLVAIVIVIVVYRAIWHREWGWSLAATCIFALIGGIWTASVLYERMEVAIWLIRHNEINANEVRYWIQRFAWKSLLPMYALWTAIPQWQWTRKVKSRRQLSDV